jgi:hypothetical protein
MSLKPALNNVIDLVICLWQTWCVKRCIVQHVLKQSVRLRHLTGHAILYQNMMLKQQKPPLRDVKHRVLEQYQLNKRRTPSEVDAFITGLHEKYACMSFQGGFTFIRISTLKH